MRIKDVETVEPDVVHVTDDVFLDTIKKLTSTLNTLFKNYHLSFREVSTKCLEITVPDDVLQLTFLSGFHFVLGFTSDTYNFTSIPKIATIRSTYPAQLKRSLTNMYIYSSICKEIQVGDTRTPLLRSLWFNRVKQNYEFGEIVHLPMKHVMYLPISQSSINSVEYILRSDSGDLIPFLPGSVTSITLHFKNHG